MEELITNELLKVGGVFAVLCVILVIYVIRRCEQREEKLSNTIDTANETNKIILEQSNELSETNRLLVQNFTNNLTSLNIKVEHMDDKLDDLKNEIRSKK